MPWCKPKLADLEIELKTASLDLGLPLEDLHAALGKGRLVPLDSYNWCLVQNSDCNSTFSLAEVEVVTTRDGQDIGPVCRKITCGQNVEAPVVLFRVEHRPWLISGNYQLMVCRALNIRPQIWRIELDGSSSQPV